MQSWQHPALRLFLYTKKNAAAKTLRHAMLYFKALDFANNVFFGNVKAY
ncbi:MAG: hypothetical protein UZ22_OP11002000679 [Microgenomates bacterium OLB23]|nr:MAG: hypothetical protein UZ22_OP11002000679 [Microgenomates bacterium OLB23]